MNTTHLAQFLPAALAGFGLFVVGGVNLLLLRAGWVVRGLATLAAIGLVLCGASSLNQPWLIEQTSWLLGSGLLVCALFSSGRFVSGLAGAIASLRTPAVRFAMLSFGGVVTIIATVVVYETRDEQVLRTETADLEFAHAQIQTVTDETHRSATDRGSVINLRLPAAARNEGELGVAEDKFLRGIQAGNDLIRRGPATDHSNCHGWVFTGGRYLLSGADVEVILKENGYEEVVEPHFNDLVVYRRGGGITHTAIIRYVTEGQPVLVEGKWGSLGTYLHPADKSIYGTDYTFYRSPRQGHLLTALPAPRSGEPRTTGATE